MKKPEFDQFAKDYDKTLSETIPEALNENLYFAEYKISLVAEKVDTSGIKKVLDFGCGAGRSLPFFKKYFPHAEIWGHDVSPESLIYAKQALPEATLFSDWSTIQNTKFDLIIAANVFHHIPSPLQLDEMKRCRALLSDRGSFFIFEHNPYNPATRWVFERCPFDHDAEMIPLKKTLDLIQKSSFSSKEYGYTLFFPKPLAFLRGMEKYMTGLPLGAQYFVQAKR